MSSAIVKGLFYAFFLIFKGLNPLSIHQKSESVLKGKVRHVRELKLVFEGIGHAVKLHGIEFFKGVFIEHGGFSFHW